MRAMVVGFDCGGGRPTRPPVGRRNRSDRSSLGPDFMPRFFQDAPVLLGDEETE